MSVAVTTFEFFADFIASYAKNNGASELTRQLTSLLGPGAADVDAFFEENPVLAATAVVIGLAAAAELGPLAVGAGTTVAVEGELSKAFEGYISDAL